MAELADALDSGSNGRKAVQVQVLLPAPSSLKPSIYAGLRDFLCVKTPWNSSDSNVKNEGVSTKNPLEIR